jgi:tetratricopeptide (TPR) repeat protein
MGKAENVLALDGLWWGQPHEVISHASTAVDLLERTGERYWLGLTHWVQGINYALIGSFEAALDEEAKCGEIGSEIGSTRLETYAAWANGAIRAFMGEAEAGIESCLRSLERSPDPFNTATALGWLGYAYVENGEPAQAISHLQKAIELVTRFGHRYTQVLYASYLSEALFLTGAPRGLAGCGEALELATGAKFQYGAALRQSFARPLRAGPRELPPRSPQAARPAARETFVPAGDQARPDLYREHRLRHQRPRRQSLRVRHRGAGVFGTDGR